MRIAYVVSTLDRCGPVNVLFDIVNHFESSWDTVVFTLAKEPDTSRIADFKAIGVTVVRVCDGRVESILAGGRMLERALKEFVPDVVHAHGFRAYLICQSLPYPSVATVHNCIYEDFLTSYGKHQARWMERKEVAALRRFDCVVACSKSNAEHLRSKYGLKVEAIRNGVDQGKYFPLDASRHEEMRGLLGVSPKKVMLVATGGCSEWKGTLPLAFGFSSACESIEADVELHIFGEGPQYKKCCALGLDGVFFHGFEPNVAPWLQAADLFVSASRSEGMPLAVLEALSCGCPVLLSDISPHREVAEVLFGQGCVSCINADNIVAISEAIKNSFGKGDILLAKPGGVTDFSARRMSSKYCRIYRSVSREERLC